MGYITYKANNSGGSWWLDDKAWKKLEAAGWVVHWYHSADAEDHEHEETEPEWIRAHHSHSYNESLVPAKSDGTRWLGALATSAAKETDDPAAAVAEWESVTGESANEEGCNCCGEPHNVVYVDDDGESHYTNVEVVTTELRWS